MEGISIIIPNYNGERLLRKNLNTLFKALKTFKKAWEIIIVDDGSTDNSVNFIRKFYPNVKLICLDKNRGFARASNEGVRQARYKIVYLLNTDVIVKSGFLDPIWEDFSQKDIFAIGSIEGDFLDALPVIKFRWGIFWYRYQKFNVNQKKPILTAFVNAGHSAYDKEKFLRLGGFDELYRPFYFEDLDICWRAWRYGWKSVYEPRSRVNHFHQSTIRRYYRPFQVQSIHWRNRFLFTWKNINLPNLWIKHLFFLPLQLFILPILGKPHFSIGFLLALLKLKLFIKKRSEISRYILREDTLFKIFSRENYGSI
jgi:GT2 family glycosyltransferase